MENITLSDAEANRKQYTEKSEKSINIYISRLYDCLASRDYNTDKNNVLEILFSS